MDITVLAHIPETPDPLNLGLMGGYELSDMGVGT